MKNLVIILSLFCFLGSTSLVAQNCNQGERIAENIWGQWGTWQPNINLIPFKNTLKKIKNGWNQIAANGSATIGPRFLDLDGVREQGTISGKTKRTFVSAPSFEDEITITVNKYDGRAETGLVICTHARNGAKETLETYTFPNNRNASTQTFTLSGVRGKVISIAMRNKSVGNKFKYRITAQ